MGYIGEHDSILDLPIDTIRGPVRPAATTTTKARAHLLRDLAVYAFFGAIALWITHQYWRTGYATTADVSDQAFFETMLTHAAQSVVHGHNPLFMTQLNAPIGVNLMANTSILVLSIPLTPITLWLGPAVSFALLMTLGPAATAAAWYHVLSRHVVASRSAAVIGGLIAGFGPGMVSHASGHPNLIAQYLLPFIAWQVVRLRETGTAIRHGAVLAALVTAQFFLNEELLLFTAFALGLLAAGYALTNRRAARAEAKQFAAGLGVAAGVTFALLAYPLWFQFFGPAAYHGLNVTIRQFSTDLAAFPAFATRTAFGPLNGNARLSLSIAEENAFFGWPLLITVAVAVYWLRRNRLARILAGTALVLALLSLGPTILVDGHDTGIPGPWRLLHNLPVFNSAVPTRITLLVLPIVAVLIALAHDKAVTAPAGATGPRFRQALLAWCALLAIALAGIAPTSIPTGKLTPTPAFYASGQWRQYVTSTQTVMPVPMAAAPLVDSMFWQAQSGLAFRMPGGYFLGPDPAQHGNSRFGAALRPTARLLADVEAKGKPAVVHQSDRDAAIADLRYWRVAVITELPSDPADKAIRETLSDLLAMKPTFVGGVWLWDVRALVSPPTQADHHGYRT